MNSLSQGINPQRGEPSGLNIPEVQNISGPEEEEKTQEVIYNLLLLSGSLPEILTCQKKEMSLSKFILQLVFST